MASENAYNCDNVDYIITSVVVRAAEKGELHGYIKKIQYPEMRELDSFNLSSYYPIGGYDNPRGGDRGVRGLEKIGNFIFAGVADGLLVLDEDLNVKEEFRDTDIFKGVHEICEFDGALFVTSTGYGGIVELAIDPQEGFVEGVENLWDLQIFWSPTKVAGKSLGGSGVHHINCVAAEGGRICYSSSERNRLCSLPDGKELCQVESYSKKHNFKEYDDLFVCNLSEVNNTVFLPKGKRGGVKKVEMKAEVDSDRVDDDIAKPNWLRGLDRINEELFVIGSSPARLYVVNYVDEEIVDCYRISDDVRHAIHGLEVVT